MIGVVRNVILAAADRANPILVKEIRQGMRSRMFLVVFTLLLVGAVALAVTISQVQKDDARSIGPYVFNAMLCCLVLAALGAVPFQAFRSMIGEHDQNTFEVLLVSGLSPRAVVWGKLHGAMLQLTVYVSVLAPFMVCSYLLGGLDIITVLFVVAWFAVTSILLAVAALWAGTITRRQPWTGGVFVLVVLALVAVMWAYGAFAVFNVTREISREISRPGFWRLVGGLALMSLPPGLLLWTMAVSQLMPEGTNRSTWPRIMLIVVLASVIAGFRIAVGPDMGIAEVWLVPACILSPVVFFGGLWAVTENATLSRRLREKAPSNPLLSLLATPFMPGAGRGWLYFLLIQLGAYLGVGWFVEVIRRALLAPGGGSHGFFASSPESCTRVWHMLTWLLCWNVILVGAVGLFNRLVMSRRPRAVRRLVGILISGGVMLIATLADTWMQNPDARYEGMYFSPFMQVAFQTWERGPAAALTEILSVLAGLFVLVNVVLVVPDLSEQLAAGRARRAKGEQGKKGGKKGDILN